MEDFDVTPDYLILHSSTAAIPAITVIINVIKWINADQETSNMGAKSIQALSRIRNDDCSLIRSMLVGRLSNSHEILATVEINTCHARDGEWVRQIAHLNIF
jgi:hypothetical protein